MSKLITDCLFCRIIRGEIPCFKLYETTHSLAFLDINPLSPSHLLIIPKFHAQKMHQLPDEYLSDILPIAKKLAVAIGAENYNILQNNGREAHQEVDHVHFHLIPKTKENGLEMYWNVKKISMEDIEKLKVEIISKL